MSATNGANAPLGVVLTPSGAEVAVYSAHASARLFLPLRRGGRARDARACALRADSSGVHSGLDRRRRPGRALRPARRRPVRPLARRPLRRRQAARRPLRGRVRPAVSSPPLDVRLRRRQRAVTRPNRSRSRSTPGEPGRQRVPWDRTVVYEANLRGLTRLARRRSRGGARLFRRPRASPRDRAFEARSASPRSRSCPPTPSSTSGTCRSLGLVQRLGLQPGRARRARPASRAGRLGRGARGDRRPSRGGHGGDPRRRPQPQRRERRIRADAVVPRPRQRLLFSPRARRSRPLRRRHGLRQLPRARPARRHAHGARRAEALDDLRRLRRLPLRSGRRARAARWRLRCAGADLPGDRRRSGPRPGQADRRTLGHRPGRLSLGAFPEGWGEWNDRFRDAARRFWRGDAGDARRTRDAPRRLARRLRALRPRRPRASTTSSRTTASRSPISSPTPTSTTRPTARHNRDGVEREFLLEPRRRGPQRRSRDPGGARARHAQSPGAAVRRARNADAGDGLRNSATASAATTTPTPRTTRSPGSTGAKPTRR